MAVKGPNHQMRTRIRGLTVLFALIGFGLVGVRLLYMQVFNHDFYVQQATALQTRDTFITPNRGKIYDANMQVLAESAAVERITVDPKAVVDESKVKKGITAESQQQTLATILSETLAVDYDTVMEKIQKTNSQYEIIAQKVDKDVSKELDEKLEAADCTGVYPSRIPSGTISMAPSCLRCWDTSAATTTAHTVWNPSTTMNWPAPPDDWSACRMHRIRTLCRKPSSTFRRPTATLLC